MTSNWDAITHDNYTILHYQLRQEPYVGNKQHLEIHTPWCWWAKGMNPDNKVAIHDLREALDAGFDGCFYCMRDYHER